MAICYSLSVSNLFRILEREKYKTILKLGSLQVNYPKMVAAAKTKYAARIVLNQMKGALVDVRRDGKLTPYLC